MGCKWYKDQSERLAAMKDYLTDLPCLCVYLMAVGKGMPALVRCHCCEEA